jgi:anti-sigma B factor antagonist
MPQAKVTMNVRKPNARVSVIDIEGEVTAFAENVLMDAYNEASRDGAKAIVLNFSNLEYMNSSGIGLLVTLLIRAQRQGQALLAYGLSDHYRQIFELTRLNEAIACYQDEEEAVMAGAPVTASKSR